MADDEILATVRAAPLRRWTAVASAGGLGVLLIALPFTADAAPLRTAVLFVLGLTAIALAEALRRATARTLVLTRAGLFEAGGRLLAPVASIRRVERGAFAFKPSSGFVLDLDRPMPAAWVPGLWWRAGQRVGVGGTLAGHETRAMADLLSVMIAKGPQSDL